MKPRDFFDAIQKNSKENFGSNFQHAIVKMFALLSAYDKDAAAEYLPLHWQQIRKLAPRMHRCDSPRTEQVFQRRRRDASCEQLPLLANCWFRTAIEFNCMIASLRKEHHALCVPLPQTSTQ